MALDKAIAHAQSIFGRAGMRTDVSSFLSALREAVRWSMDGRSIDDVGSDRFPTVQSARRVLECVRRHYIVELHTARVSGQHAIRALAALGEVECSLLGGRTDSEDWERSIEHGSLGLSVEVAHDMRSPLTAILFLLDMLRSGRSGAITPAQARQLGIIYDAAFGLSQLAADLVDHARAEDRIIEGHPVPFSVTEVLQSVRDILAPVTEEQAAELRIVTLADDARMGFPAALHRILLNLATNAVKFTPKGTVSVVARELSGARVQFSVTDTGPGIPRAVREQLFQPFSPAAWGQPSFSRSRLGLSICKSLVTGLGSRLRVTSAPSKGTRFVFVLELPGVDEP